MKLLRIAAIFASASIGTAVLVGIYIRGRLQPGYGVPPEVYRAAGLSLARLCQSDPSFYETDPFSDVPAWVPPEVLKLGPRFVTVSRSRAHVECGGGHWHYGYALSMDSSRSTGSMNEWVLEGYSESRRIVLHRFGLSNAARFGLPEFLQYTMAEYARRAQLGPNDDNVRSRIAFLLKHQQGAWALRSIHEYAASDPHNWLDQILSFILAGPNDPTARQRLESWALREDDYTSWLLAAYALDAVGESAEADRLVRRALAKPPNDPPWTRYHARARSISLCRRLYGNGSYGTCVSLCDALLSYRGAEDSFGAELRGLRSSAQQALRGAVPASMPSPEPGGVDLLGGIPLETLRALAAGRPSATTKGALGGG